MAACVMSVSVIEGQFFHHAIRECHQLEVESDSVFAVLSSYAWPVWRRTRKSVVRAVRD